MAAIRHMWPFVMTGHIYEKEWDHSANFSVNGLLSLEVQILWNILILPVIATDLGDSKAGKWIYLDWSALAHHKRLTLILTTAHSYRFCKLYAWSCILHHNSFHYCTIISFRYNLETNMMYCSAAINFFLATFFMTLLLYIDFS